MEVEPVPKIALLPGLQGSDRGTSRRSNPPHKHVLFFASKTARVTVTRKSAGGHPLVKPRTAAPELAGRRQFRGARLVQRVADGVGSGNAARPPQSQSKCYLPPLPDSPRWPAYGSTHSAAASLRTEALCPSHRSSIDMYNNDVGKRFMK